MRQFLETNFAFYKIIFFLPKFNWFLGILYLVKLDLYYEMEGVLNDIRTKSSIFDYHNWEEGECWRRYRPKQCLHNFQHLSFSKNVNYRLSLNQFVTFTQQIKEAIFITTRTHWYILLAHPCLFLLGKRELNLNIPNPERKVGLKLCETKKEDKLIITFLACLYQYRVRIRVYVHGSGSYVCFYLILGIRDGATPAIKQNIEVLLVT